MQHATAATVLGDFDNARFTYNGIVSRFFRRDGKFFVNTDGPDGALADFEIRYTFGVYPLQQYLVAFPDGRMQALPIAWDARSKDEGGAHWYHLYPDEHVTFKDALHWTRLNQNWNWMCADCHTTKLARNYNADKNTYATTWSESNVACEACHGPGSEHLVWARRGTGYEKMANRGLVVALDERSGVQWTRNAATGNPIRSVPLTTERELDDCAQCHSRREPFADGMGHDGRFLDTHAVALLSGRLYFPDGQQRDEVYEVGSFLQSRMHARGVTCSDCHEPHSGKLRAAGNEVCTQCHTPEKYDTRGHTLHAAASRGAQCAECHMPARNYMVIDSRRDHSIRIPRPDLSEQLGTPNACTGCHATRTAAWAAQVISRAYGPQREGFQTFGTALHAAHIGAPGAPTALVAAARNPELPAIARATLLTELGPYLSAAVIPAIDNGLSDPDAMVRGAALDALLAAPPQERVRRGLPLINDSSPIVRIKTARALAAIPDQGGDPALRAQLDTIFAEYVASQRANADRPEAHLNLGLFYLDRRDPAHAEAEYRAALALDPDFVPAYVNLADMYRIYQRDSDGETILETGLQTLPGQADLQYALGLLRVRQGRTEQALQLFAGAMHADPGTARYAFTYGVALHDSGQPAQGIAVMEQALKRFPHNAQLLSALAAYARDSGDLLRAAAYSRQLEEAAPAAARPP